MKTRSQASHNTGRSLFYLSKQLKQHVSIHKAVGIGTVQGFHLYPGLHVYSPEKSYNTEHKAKRNH